LVRCAARLSRPSIIGLSDGVISMFYSPTLAKIIATAAVAMVLVFRPQGLFGARA